MVGGEEHNQDGRGGQVGTDDPVIVDVEGTAEGADGEE